MRLPSEKTIGRLPWINKLKNPRKTIKLVRQALEYASGKPPSEAIREILRSKFDHYHQPSRHYRAMRIMNDLLDTYGVEFIKSRDDTLWECSGIEYLNTGDAYTPTIIYDYRHNTYTIGSWGGRVEHNPRRFK